jgi:hypothetical protein
MEKIVISQNNNKINKIYPTDQNEGVFTIKDKYDNLIVMATTEHENLKIISECDKKMGGRCDSCKDDFNHTAIGYPVTYDKQVILENNKYHTNHIFYTKGKFCSFQCALYWMKLVHEKTDLIQFMYSLYNTDPDKAVLRCVNEPRLRVKNGGSLTEEEWKDEKYFFVNTNKNIKCIPLKTEYQRKMNSSFVKKNNNDIYTS